MPSSGDQHKPNGATANPFEEPEHRISEFTAREIATLSSRLEKQLGPEFISSRPGAAGQRVHYLAAEKCINLANEIFGFNGWSSSIKNIQIDFVDESAGSGKVSLGLSVIVRVTLRDGTYHEDIGYGHIENCKGKAAAFEKAKKEGTTDALKRALRNFGNVLGNCIYDKDYLGRVLKVKVAPSKWDENNLHRHPDYAPVKKEPEKEKEANGATHHSSEIPSEEDFGGEDFDEADFSESHIRGHPDEVPLDPALAPRQIPGQANPDVSRLWQPNFRGVSADIPESKINRPGNGAANAGQPERQAAQLPQAAQHAMPTIPQQPHTPVPPQRTGNAMPPRQNFAPPQNGPYVQHKAPQQMPPASRHTMNPAANNVNVQVPPQNAAALRPPPQGYPSPKLGADPRQLPQKRVDPPVGFYPAGVATMIQEANAAAPVHAPTFNPHAESPSIRKTSGIDHSRSGPVNKDLIGTIHQGVGAAAATAAAAAAVAPPPQPARVPNVTNPHLDANRKIGMPNSPSTFHNRPPYKPPGPAPVKRSLDGGVAQQARAPLGDISNNNSAQADGPADPKRTRLSN